MERLISTKFADFNCKNIDGKLVDNKTLRQTLTDERHKRKATGGRLPARLFADLRDKYQGEESPMKQLKVTTLNDANIDLCSNDQKHIVFVLCSQARVHS